MSAKAKNRLTPQQRKATLTRVLGKIRPYSLFVVCSLIVAAVSVGAQLYIPILCGSAIDLMLGKGTVDFGGVMRIMIEVLVVAAAAALAQWLLSVCNNRITFLVSRDLRNEALRKIQTLPLSYLDSHPSGDIVSRMVADVDTFADGLLVGFTQLFSGILTILGTLLFMLSENVPITLVVVCITPLSLVVASFLAKRSYGYFQSQSTVRGEQTALVNEMIEGQKVVQAFGHETESLAAFDEVNGRLQDVSLKAIFFSSMTNPATRFVNNIVYAGVGLVGALYTVRGGITIGQLSVFLSYANQYTKPFNEISGVVTELQNALACAARVFELLDADDQVPEAENAPVLQPDGHVQLENVSFRYLPDRPLIEGLSLDVKPGQRIAIVGPTGCGKTTLINLLMRFYDVNGGSIKVSGTDIRDVTRASLRGCDPRLPAGQLRHGAAGHLAAGRYRAGEHRLRQAGRHAGRSGGSSQSRPRRQLHPPPARGLRHRYRRGRRQHQSGPEAAAVHRPRDALPAADADFGRGHLLHRYPHRGAHPESLCPHDAGPHQLHRSPPPFHHPGGRPHPCDEGRPHRGAGRSRPASGCRRLLRQALQQPVRRCGDLRVSDNNNKKERCAASLLFVIICFQLSARWVHPAAE